MNQESVVANIQKLIAQLNGEIHAAREMGLKVGTNIAHTASLMGGPYYPEEIRVRIWQENDIVNTFVPLHTQLQGTSIKLSNGTDSSDAK
jgi:hypothetical protein